MTLTELVRAAHGASREKGWYDGVDSKRNIGEMLMLVVTEASEAMEEYRVRDPIDLATLGLRDEKGKPVGFASEVADVIIRIGDLCGYLGIDLDAAVAEKMAYNVTRPHRHGGKRA